MACISHNLIKVKANLLVKDDMSVQSREEGEILDYAASMAAAE